MFEVITTYTVENEVELMGLRAELGYMLRSMNMSDVHLISSIIQGEKTYITLIYTDIEKNGDYLQNYANSYNSHDILVLDHLEYSSLDCNRHWLYDAINLIGGRDGKYYVPMKDILKPIDEYSDSDIIVMYNRYRMNVIAQIKGLWDGMLMKDIGTYYNNGWPIEETVHNNWYKVKEHIPRIMGDYYTFYSQRLRDVKDLKFRIPYNYSVIHEICIGLPDYNLDINGGFLTIHNVNTYSDIKDISNVIERSLLVKYKTADYWGDVQDTLQPWTHNFNIQAIRINGHLCHLVKIPNAITVEDGRKMIAYMLQVKVK